MDTMLFIKDATKFLNEAQYLNKEYATRHTRVSKIHLMELLISRRVMMEGRKEKRNKPNLVTLKTRRSRAHRSTEIPICEIMDVFTSINSAILTKTTRQSNRLNFERK